MKHFLYLFTAVIFFLGVVPAHANDVQQIVPIDCLHPTHQEPGLVRPYGDSNRWTFTIQLKNGANWYDGPHWSHSGGSGATADPTWGQWSDGQDGQSTIAWSQPDHTGVFFVTVTGQITCGGSGGGGPIDIHVDWFGNVKGKHWDPGTAIGKKPQTDGTTIEDGRIISPQDWRVDPPDPPIVLVDPGETIDLEIETATDYDHWELGDDDDIDLDTITSYTWDVIGGVLTPTDGKGQTATWKAPDQGGPYLIKCTVEDEPKPIKDGEGEEDEGEDGDRDDDPLIRQMQVKVASWEVSFDDQNPKACAGHVADSVHEFMVTATLTREGVIVPNHAITFYFDGNTNSGKMASFVTGSQDSGDDLTQQIHLTTDPNGEASFTVLSSEAITNNIKIKAKYTAAGGQEILLDDEVTCNFEEAESIRNFDLDPNVNSFAEDDDNGWWFDPDVLISGGDQTTAKIYLKYKKDGIWDAVDGHTMKITIGKIIDKDGNEINESNYDHYIYFVDADGNRLLDENNQLQNFAEAVTTTYSISEEDIQRWFEGFATVYLKGGDFIYQAKTITLKAEDQTQVK